MRKRRLLSLLTAVALTASFCMPINALAAEDGRTESVEITTVTEAASTSAPITTTANKTGNASLADKEEGLGETASTAVPTQIREDISTWEAMTNPEQPSITAATTMADNTQKKVLDKAVLYVPYAHLLARFDEEGASTTTTSNMMTSTTTSTTTTSATTTSVTTTNTTEVTTTTATTVITKEVKPEDISELLDYHYEPQDNGYRLVMDYAGDDAVLKLPESYYNSDGLPNVKFEKEILYNIPWTYTETDTDTTYHITSVDITNGWWQKVPLGTVSVPRGMPIIYNGNEITPEEVSELIRPAGNTLTITDSTYSGASATMPTEASGFNPFDTIYSFRTPQTINGRLPKGLMYYPDTTEIYGVPTDPDDIGTFTFTIEDLCKNQGIECIYPEGYEYLAGYTFELTVLANTNVNVYNQTDAGYELLKTLGTDVGGYDFVVDLSDTVMRSKGEFVEFYRLVLNGKELRRGIDYLVESGSTIITASEDVLENVADPYGENTIALEYRVTDPDKLNDINDSNDLRVASQNFRLKKETTSPSYRSTPKQELNPPVLDRPVAVLPASDVASSPKADSSSSSMSSSTSSSVTTGDDRPYWLFVAGTLVALLGIFVAFPRKKEKQEKINR